MYQQVGARTLALHQSQQNVNFLGVGDHVAGPAHGDPTPSVAFDQFLLHDRNATATQAHEAFTRASLQP